MSVYFSSEGGRTPHEPYTLRKLKNFNFKENRKKAKLKEAGDLSTQFSTFISTLNYKELSISPAVAIKLGISSQQGALSLVTSRFCFPRISILETKLETFRFEDEDDYKYDI